MPAAGQPLAVSSTCVVSFPMSSSRSRPRNACGTCKSVYTLPHKASRHDVPSRPSTAGDHARHRRRARPAPAAQRPAASAPTGGRRHHPRIADSITTAIVERRLMPGTKLAEQKIADIFKVSRTLVRQALNQLSRDKLVTLEPARGARVAEPSVEEARQVFEMRHMLEAAMVRRAGTELEPAQIAELRAHLRAEQAAVRRTDVAGPHPAARRLPRRAGAHARQRGAGGDARRAGVALVADRADVPVGALGRALVRGARGDRRCARAARRARRGPADGRAPAARRAQPAPRSARPRPGARP